MSDLGDLRSSLMKLESVIAERVIATQAARITELEEVLDKIETDNHITNGNLWRFWSRKAGEVADNNRALTAKVARLQSEQDQLLSDSMLRSDQRVKYEKLYNEIATSPRLAQQEAIDAIKALCRDNERLALWQGKSQGRMREALEALRSLVPRAMKAVMYQGREGLLLADEIHRADDKARIALEVTS